MKGLAMTHSNQQQPKLQVEKSLHGFTQADKSKRRKFNEIFQNSIIYESPDS